MGEPEAMKSAQAFQSAAMADLSEFMTTREAARKLGFNVRSIPYMVRNNTLDGVRVGRLWLVSAQSVREYLRKTRGFTKNDPRRKRIT
jgi:excisionase family DNA binding protein